jgi:thiol:disulfide interchange protein
MIAKKRTGIFVSFLLVVVLVIASVTAIFKPPKSQNSQQASQSSGPTTEISPKNEIYLPYSSETYAATKDKKRVLFFAASWCPTCQAADKEFSSNLDRIPTDTVVLKVDYDAATDLKSTYNIVSQHTFVLLDMQDNEIVRWSGGGIDELISYTYSQ